MLSRRSLYCGRLAKWPFGGNSAGVNVLVIPNEVTKHSDLTPNYMERESLAEVDLTEIMAEYNK